MTAYNAANNPLGLYRVVVKGGDDRNYREGRANTAIYPGMLVYQNVANADGSVDPATSTNFATVKKVDVALEQMYVSGGPFDQYAVNSVVQYQNLHGGDEFMGRVAAGAAQITFGDMVGIDPNNPGCVLTTTAAGSSAHPAAIGFARQTVNNSAGASAVTCRIEVL